MSQSDYFSEFQKAVSAERLNPYLNAGDDAQAFAIYLWNISLCESLYPCLNGLEVALRNNLHRSASTKFGTASWFSGQLKNPELERLERWRKQTDPHGKKTLKADDFVAGMSLGFWVDLFKKRYEQVLWPSLLREVFPLATKKQRARESAFQRLSQIQALRNRVFHHEPIWYLQDLEQQHRSILETIGWISPAMLAATRLLDRFTSVYTKGPQAHAEGLESIAQNWAR